jgi:hypothetical protein
MKKWEIFVLAIHGLAYVLWYWDSKTVESWRNRRRYWAGVREAEIVSRTFEEDLYAYLNEQSRDARKMHEYGHLSERERLRREAMRRHPTRAQFNVDYETMMGISKDEKKKKDARGAAAGENKFSKEFDFWSVLDEDDKNWPW